MLRLHTFSLLIAACAVTVDQPLWGQMVATQMPLQSNSSSFYEQSHIGWGIHNPHYFMEFNGAGANPPFGGYQPNAGLHTGFAVGNAHFDMSFAQGASLGSTMASPVLTTTSGYPSFLFMGGQYPFVTGVVPTVGATGFASLPPQGILASRMAAGEFRMENRRVVAGGKNEPVRIKQPDLQPPRPLQAAAALAKTSEPSTSKRDLTAVEYFERAAVAQKEGRNGVAKIYFQLAATKGDAIMKSQATSKLEELKTASAAKP